MRAASNRSSGTALMAEERMTMAKPVCSHTRITIRKRLFQKGTASHRTGSLPRADQMALRRPIWLPKPSERKL